MIFPHFTQNPCWWALLWCSESLCGCPRLSGLELPSQWLCLLSAIAFPQDTETEPTATMGLLVSAELGLGSEICFHGSRKWTELSLPLSLLICFICLIQPFLKNFLPGHLLSLMQQKTWKKIPWPDQATSLKVRTKIVTFIKHLEGSQILKAEKAGYVGKYYLMGNESSFFQ